MNPLNLQTIFKPRAAEAKCEHILKAMTISPSYHVFFRKWEEGTSKLCCCTSSYHHFYLLTLVTASIFYDLALLLIRRRFEDVGSVELKLFDALLDVIQSSGGNKTLI